jgi:hypothetical protein
MRKRKSATPSFTAAISKLRSGSMKKYHASSALKIVAKKPDP